MREFYKLRGNYYNVTSIKSIRFVKTDKKSKDGATRPYVVTVDPQCTGTDPRYAYIWCTKEEVNTLLEDAEREATYLLPELNENNLTGALRQVALEQSLR